MLQEYSLGEKKTIRYTKDVLYDKTMGFSLKGMEARFLDIPIKPDRKGDSLVLVEGPFGFVFLKDTSMLESHKTQGNFGSVKIFASKSNPYPSEQDCDYCFDLSSRSVIE